MIQELLSTTQSTTKTSATECCEVGQESGSMHMCEMEEESSPQHQYQNIGTQATPSRRNVRTQVAPKGYSKGGYIHTTSYNVMHA